MTIKRKIIAILIGSILGLNAAASGGVTDALDSQALACAWESQSVLLYYSFCSVLPLKIMNHLVAGETPAPVPTGQKSTPSKQENRSSGAPGVTIEFKTSSKPVKKIDPASGGFCIAAACSRIMPALMSSRVFVSTGFVGLLMLMFLVFLPRSGIEDAVKNYKIT